jgi:hypothetical protein
MPVLVQENNFLAKHIGQPQPYSLDELLTFRQLTMKKKMI